MVINVHITTIYIHILDINSYIVYTTHQYHYTARLWSSTEINTENIGILNNSLCHGLSPSIFLFFYLSLIHSHSLFVVYVCLQEDSLFRPTAKIDGSEGIICCILMRILEFFSTKMEASPLIVMDKTPIEAFLSVVAFNEEVAARLATASFNASVSLANFLRKYGHEKPINCSCSTYLGQTRWLHISNRYNQTHFI